MRILKFPGFGILLLVVAAQFFPPDRQTDSFDPALAMERRFPIPDDVAAVLTRSCHDCHSDRTVYPWYASVQPVGWWLADHIEEGRGHLNFDRFLTYSTRRQFHKFEEIREMIEQDEMPLPSYLIIHRDAVLTPDAAALLMSWSDAMRDSMSSWYPPDSLMRPVR